MRQEADAGESPRARLERRHRELLARHQALLDRLSGELRSESAFQRLSWFALQRSSSALAMFRDGRVVLGNARWQALASARKKAAGWTVGEGAHARRHPELASLCAVELARLTREHAVTTVRCERQAPRQVLRVRLERVAEAGEGPVGLVLAVDVTDETEREAEMAALRETVRKKEQMAALGRLAAGVAHDLGNTVNALALRVGRLARTRAVDAAQLRGLDEAVEMMRATLDRLDRFSGRRGRLLAPVDLAAVIRSAVDGAGLAPTRRARRGTAVKLALPASLPRVLADAAELKHVFVNLFLNARDAMGGRGVITVAAVADDERVTVRVSDEGPGFSPEALARVFEPFFSTKGARGHGLGLSLAYGFMEAIGGSIRAANRPGGGAEVTLELPRAPSVPDGRGVGRVGVGRRRKRLQ